MIHGICKNWKDFLILLIGFLSASEVSGQQPNLGGRPCGPCPDGQSIQGGYPGLPGYCPPCGAVSQSCAKGYYLEGQQCVSCPCRAPGAYCQRGNDYQLQCNCPEGYSGRFCENCGSGWIQQPQYPYHCIRGQRTPCNGPQCNLPTVCPDGGLWPNCLCPPCPRIPLQPPITFPPTPWPPYCPPCNFQPLPPPIQCPVQPVCPYPIPERQECPVLPVCPMPVPPNTACPFLPVCPIPIPTPGPGRDCPVTPICPIPVQPCNVTCNCDCRGNGSTIIRGPCPCRCDPRGTAFQVGEKCVCKTNVEGPTCSVCKPGYFGLRHSNPNGCDKCFCSGVSNMCTFAPFYVGLSTCSMRNDVKIVDSAGKEYEPTFRSIGSASYRFNSAARGNYYWNLSDLCTGNRVNSYGLRLTAEIEYTSRNSAAVPGIDIIIEGQQGFSIFWTGRGSYNNQAAHVLSAVLDDNNAWMVSKNNRSAAATRRDIMFVLANVQRIFVRATFTESNMESTTLNRVELEEGVSRQQSGQPERYTLQVEDCSCPIGYSGHSCQECAPSFYRDPSDFSYGVFGTCKRCPCKDPNAKCRLVDGVPKCPDDSQTDDFINLKLKPTHVKCCAGEEVEFTCTYESSRQLQLEFPPYPDHKLPQPRRSSNGISMTLKLELNGRQDRVVCQLRENRNGVLYTVGELISFINVRPCKEPPLIIPPPTAYLEVSPFQCVRFGEEIQLNCTAYSFLYGQRLQVNWSRNGQPLRGRQRGAGYLIIPNAGYEDTGDYYCTVSSGNTMLLERATVVVYKPSGNPPYNCEEKIPYPFLRQDDQPSPSLSRTQLGDNLPSQQISVFGLTTTASSAGSSNETLSHRQRKGVAPRIAIEPANLDASVGDHVEFHCKILEGSPDGLTVYWRKKDGSLDLDLQVDDETTLRFGPVNKEHEGEYHCIVTNDYGKSGDRAHLAVHEKQKGEVTSNDIGTNDKKPFNVLLAMKPRGGIARLSDKVELHCYSKDARVPINVRWHKESGEIRSEIAMVESDGQLLVLPSVTIEDSGWYICTAQSRLTGEVVSVKTRLIVKSEMVGPTVTISEESPLIVRQGHPVRLECQTFGDPAPILSWSRFINTIDGVQEQVLLEAQTNTAVFEIRRATKDHDGEYFCTGRNDGGEDRVSLLLVVDEGIKCNEDLEFRCYSGDQCIALGDECDGEKDCRDGSDERHCHHKHS